IRQRPWPRSRLARTSVQAWLAKSYSSLTPKPFTRADFHLKARRARRRRSRSRSSASESRLTRSDWTLIDTLGLPACAGDTPVARPGSSRQQTPSTLKFKVIQSFSATVTPARREEARG